MKALTESLNKLFYLLKYILCKYLIYTVAGVTYNPIFYFIHFVTDTFSKILFYALKSKIKLFWIKFIFCGNIINQQKFMRKLTYFKLAGS